MTIQEQTVYSASLFEGMKHLMEVLDPERPFTEQILRDVVENENNHLYGLLDGDRLIGCATLCVYCSPTGKKAAVEDVVVLSDYRGQHLGRTLLEFILERARELSPIDVHLTSRPSRVAANALYQSLGFERRDTNCYVLKLR